MAFVILRHEDGRCAGQHCFDVRHLPDTRRTPTPSHARARRTSYEYVVLYHCTWYWYLVTLHLLRAVLVVLLLCFYSLSSTSRP